MELLSSELLMSSLNFSTVVLSSLKHSMADAGNKEDEDDADDDGGGVDGEGGELPFIKSSWNSRESTLILLTVAAAFILWLTNLTETVDGSDFSNAIKDFSREFNCDLACAMGLSKIIKSKICYDESYKYTTLVGPRCFDQNETWLGNNLIERNENN